MEKDTKLVQIAVFILLSILVAYMCYIASTNETITVYFDIEDKFISGNQWSHSYYFVIRYNDIIREIDVGVSEYYSYEIDDEYPMSQVTTIEGRVYYNKVD